MADNNALYQLEIKLPSKNGVAQTQELRIKGVSQLLVDTFDNFPALGEVGKLYIATDLSGIFIWDAISSDYMLVGIGNGGIAMIDGGDETEENWGKIETGTDTGFTTEANDYGTTIVTSNNVSEEKNIYGKTLVV